LHYHDKGSQFTRVDEAYNYLLSTGKFEEIKINWEDIFEYVKWHNLEDGKRFMASVPGTTTSTKLCRSIKT
jgi:hypothetical protein